MNRYAGFRRDDAGRVVADWVALAAGILLVGTMVVYGIANDGVSSLKSTAGGTPSDVEVGVDAGSATNLNGTGGKDSSAANEACSFPRICSINGVRHF